MDQDSTNRCCAGKKEDKSGKKMVAGVAQYAPFNKARDPPPRDQPYLISLSLNARKPRVADKFAN